MTSEIKTTAVVADTLWHFTVREDDSGGQWLATGRFMETVLEKRADSAIGAEKAWIAAARKLIA